MTALYYNYRDFLPEVTSTSNSILESPSGIFFLQAGKRKRTCECTNAFVERYLQNVYDPTDPGTGASAPFYLYQIRMVLNRLFGLPRLNADVTLRGDCAAVL